MSKVFIAKSAEETVELGRKIGAQLTGGELITLAGDLGSGKTQLTKGIASGMGITETVISPTFMIERIYEGPSKKLVLHHLDLYRLQNDAEIAGQIDEFTGTPGIVTVVEWPENIEAILGKNRLNIDFEYTGDDERKITLNPVSSPTSQINYDKLIGYL